MEHHIDAICPPHTEVVFYENYSSLKNAPIVILEFFWSVG